MKTQAAQSTITADEFLKITAEQRASLPENLTIIGDLNLSDYFRPDDGVDTSTLKLPDNLTIKGNLDISVSWLPELPKNLTVTGSIDGVFSEIRSLPDGLTVLGGADFSESYVKTIGKDVKIHGNLDLSDTPIQSIVGVEARSIGNSNLLCDNFNSNAIVGIIPYSVSEQERMASNAHTPPEVLAVLANGRWPDLREAVAGNPNASAETLTALQKDEVDSVRARAAVTKNNKNFQAAPSTITADEFLKFTPKENSMKLPDRWRLASNPGTPSQSLAALAHDEAESVRLRVAANPNTSLETLALLAKDRIDIVCMNVAKNPSTPLELLYELANSQDKMVSRAARRVAKAVEVLHGQEIDPAIPKKIGDVSITPEQRQALQDGKSIIVSGLKDKAGNLHSATHVIFDKNTNRMRMRLLEKKSNVSKAEKAQVSIASPKPKKGLNPAKKKKAGLRM